MTEKIKIPKALKNFKVKKFWVITIVLMLMAFVFSFNGAGIRICYDRDDYRGENTLYYSVSGEGYCEDQSIYSAIVGDKSEFDCGSWKSIFIIPNRVVGQSVGIKSIKFTVGGVAVSTIGASKLYDKYISNTDAEYMSLDSDTLLVKADETNQYPMVSFKEDFFAKLNSLSVYALCLKVLAAVVTAGLLLLLRYLLKRFGGKHSRLVVFGILSLVLVFASMCYFNRYRLVVRYAEDMSEESATVYFDYDDSGFRELNAVYTDIEGQTGVNTFFGASKLEGLRLTPDKDVNKAAKILSVDVYRENTLLKSYTPDELINRYIKNTDGVTQKNDCLVVATTESNPYQTIVFNNAFTSELDSINKDVVISDIIRLLVLCLIMLVVMLFYCFGKNFNGGELKFKYTNLAISTVVFAVAVLCWFVEVVWLLYTLAAVVIATSAFCAGRFKLIRGDKRIVYPVSAFVIAAVFLMNMQISVLYNTAYFIYPFWNVCMLALMSACLIRVYESLEGNYALDADKKSELHINNIAGYFVKTVLVVLVYEFVKIYLLYDYPSVTRAVALLLDGIVQLNIFFIFMLVCALYGALGRGATNVITGVASFLLVVGNGIKIRYHNTLLAPDDFQNIKEMFAIAPKVIGKLQYYAILAVILVLLVAVVINIKRVLRYIKPRPFIPLCIVAIIFASSFTKQVIDKKYVAVNLFNKPYDDVTNERTNGVGVHYFFKFLLLSQNKMQQPEGYTKENVEKLKAEFDSIGATTDDTRPNVICILAEAYFDMNNVSDFEISEDLIPNTREMGLTGMLSPHYGGYTAAVEYEVMTGNTLAFYPNGVVPYTSYYNKKNRQMPSVPLEFSDNGYKLYAIHPNEASFYNRDNAYKMMGFDEYYALDTFDKQYLTENKEVKDIEVADKIISTIEDNDEPVFTLGITMESHFTTEERFKDTTVTVSGDGLSDSDIYELEQQAQAYRDLDDMLGYLKDYIDNSDEPTLLYVFGDHLPPISALSNSSYVQDINNKYRTVGLAYSNYKEVSLKDMATPNYIGAQMLIDAGVKHSSYFDYIYSLRDKMPQLHKEFMEIDTENNEDLKKYYMLQYDLVFGEQWFYEADK